MAALTRRATLGALAAAASAPAAAKDRHTVPTLRGDDTDRLPDHAAFWARLPLPFTPAEAWRLLSPATQAEIGAAVIGMALAQYMHGDAMAEADQFHDDALREAASDVEHDILNRLDDRLWALLPDLYGPDGDHPQWALKGGFAS